MLSEMPSVVKAPSFLARVRRLLAWRWFGAVCLTAALGLRLGAVALCPVPPESDFLWYYQRAIDLTAGHGLSVDGAPTAFWPVGYPALLALVFRVAGPSVLAAQLANVAMSLGSLVLARRLSRKLLGSPLAANATMALLAVHPNQVAYCTLVANETLATLLILAGAALVLDGRRLLPVFVGGAVFGAAALVKPQAAVLPSLCIVGPWLLAHGERRATLGRTALRVAIVHIALALAIAPWLWRDQRRFGGFVFVANSGGLNLLIGHNADADGGYPSATLEPRLWAEVRAEARSNEERELDRAAARLAARYLVGHPLQTLARTPLKLWHLYAKDVEGLYWIGEGLKPHGGWRAALLAAKLAAQLYWVALLALAFSSLASRPVRKRLAVPMAIVGGLTAVYLVYFGSSRFHFPMLPWIVVCAAGAVLPRLVSVRRVARPSVA